MMKPLSLMSRIKKDTVFGYSLHTEIIANTSNAEHQVVIGQLALRKNQLRTELFILSWNEFQQSVIVERFQGNGLSIYIEVLKFSENKVIMTIFSMGDIVYSIEIRVKRSSCYLM